MNQEDIATRCASALKLLISVSEEMNLSKDIIPITLPKKQVIKDYLTIKFGGSRQIGHSCSVLKMIPYFGYTNVCFIVPRQKQKKYVLSNASFIYKDLLRITLDAFTISSVNFKIDVIDYDNIEAYNFTNTDLVVVDQSWAMAISTTQLDNLYSQLNESKVLRNVILLQ